MRGRSIVWLIVLVATVTFCEQSRINNNLFKKGASQGTNKNKHLEEASGLAVSRCNPGYLWTHNDSGNPAELFLLDGKASTVKVYTLAGIRNRDWEDMTIGPGISDSSQYIYLGDIGDNLSRYPVKYIYRFPEPRLTGSDVITAFDTLIVKLSDGVRDTETMMLDPISKNLYLVSKREDSVRLYEINYPFAGDTLTAHKVATLDLKSIVGGDISKDGSEVLLKNYKHIYYWKRKGKESIPELLQTAPTELPYEQEILGEAIAWDTDGGGFFTLGENGKGERAKLFFYERKAHK